MDNLATLFIFNGIVVAIAVIVHCEALYRLALWLPKLQIPARFRALVGVSGTLLAHVVEVWVFAVGYFLMLKWGTDSTLEGNFGGTLLDCGYFSFTSYTSLGLGDIEPLGHIRFLVGLEALTGLILVAWTASFLYIQMQKYWLNEVDD